MKGIEFDKEIVTEGEVRIAYFTDPDKNPLYLIEVTQDSEIK